MNRLITLLSPKKVNLPPRTNGWYGKIDSNGNEVIPEDNTAIRKFSIEIDDQELEILRQKLMLSKYHEPLNGVNFQYGFNSRTLMNIVDYWKNTYNWRKCEQELNKYDQYKTQIEGIDIHYVHVKPKNPDGVVLPLLAIHGWPGSFYEYYKTIPLLIDYSAEGLSFEVILPSIPGYGFSEAPHTEGFNCISAARIFVKLMERLGFKKFFVHGGDWGSIISRTIALMYPEYVRGIHTTLLFPIQPNGPLDTFKYFIANYFPSFMFKTNSQRAMFNELVSNKSRWELESGYLNLQMTKPDTVGAALTDSPIGLAAYILEKFSTGTNYANIFKQDGGLTEKFTYDELITNVMIYWFSNNITPSMRFYKENLNPIFGILPKYKIGSRKISRKVPAGYAVFPNEIFRLPKFMAEMIFENLIHYSEKPNGGHFAAMEVPELLADDLKKFAFTVVTKA